MVPALYRLLFAACVLVCGIAPGSARAEEPSSSPPLDISILTAESEANLDELRGGEELTEIGAISLTESTSTVTNNQVNGQVTTGSIGLSPDAFSNLQGIFVSTFNTGNNTSIQTSLTVQVRLGQ